MGGRLPTAQLAGRREKCANEMCAALSCVSSPLRSMPFLCGCLSYKLLGF